MRIWSTVELVSAWSRFEERVSRLGVPSLSHFITLKSQLEATD